MTLTQALHNDFVGFDRMLDRMHQINTHQHKPQNYPPYNIIKDGEKYTVELAVAGWKQDDITIHVEDGELKIEGNAPEVDGDIRPEFIHRGIGLRSFKRTFQLADTVVVNGASMADGILSIQLENVIPEHKKPRQILIDSRPAEEQLEFKELLTEE
jgi:molecular chaperone IbpA